MGVLVHGDSEGYRVATTASGTAGLQAARAGGNTELASHRGWESQRRPAALQETNAILAQMAVVYKLTATKKASQKWDAFFFWALAEPPTVNVVHSNKALV